MARRPGHSEEGFAYRSAVIPILHDDTPDTDVNRDQYSTLKSVHTEFTAQIKSLNKDFNAFELLEGHDPDVVARDLVVQIKGNQKAYDILMPLYEAMTNALAKVDSKYKEG